MSIAGVTICDAEILYWHLELLYLQLVILDFFIENESELTGILWCYKVVVPNVVAARLHMMMYGVGRDGADLHESVVLDEDRVTGEVAVHYCRRTFVKIAEKTMLIYI